ncbi:MAG: RNA methyltransferase [Pirellulales bacterium]
MAQHDRQITSRQNPRVKQTMRLRDRRHRQRQGLTLIEGVREVTRALSAGIVLEEVFVCAEHLHGQEAGKLLQELARQGVAPWHVPPPVHERLAFGDRAEGVLAVARTPSPTLEELAPLLGDRPLVAVLDGIEKPGNLGAVLRSADAAGISAVIVADGGTDLFNPNAIRASLGTIFTVPICAAPGEAVFAWLREQKLAIAAARPDAEQSYTSFDWRRPAAIVLGSEATGVSGGWAAADVTPLVLPMRGAADSLNVAATAAIIFYEALRQREASP